MATAEDILKKSRTKKGKFQAVKRRAWDYLDTPLSNENTQAKSDENKSNLILDKTPPLIKIDVEKTFEETNEVSIDHEKNLKTDSHDSYSYRESIDTPTKEAVQKKLLTLKGHQKQIMRLVTSHIKSRGGAPYTVGIFPNILAVKIKADIEVIRVSLKRLVEKNLLVRLKGEKGRNGCCKFKAREDVVKVCFTLFNDSPCDINLIGNEIEES